MSELIFLRDCLLQFSYSGKLFGIFLLSTGSKGDGNCDDTESARKNAKISFTFHSENGSLGRRSKKILEAVRLCVKILNHIFCITNISILVLDIRSEINRVLPFLAGGLAERSFRAPTYRCDTNEVHKERTDPLVSKTKSVNFLIASV